ncbi:hypothetical protein SAY87_001105 [Trapa incisa]|uniref:C2H2-type domain-containing protein n=1 Tax=Trapa incisa TaxID=236973 RepID=A0AAN7GJY8_9MYRT|nr:hypothetical protein SAY87_001105 [Trapa incisa]
MARSNCLPAKRSVYESSQLFESMAVAKCLISLSQSSDVDLAGAAAGGSSPARRVFECKTCSRQFHSFQALGGHRASHKKPRLSHPDDHQGPESPEKPKTHECPVCGLEFAIGQALGGHMRRHRAVVGQHKADGDEMALTTTLNLLPPPAALTAGSAVRNSSSRRVLCPDLNLTPLEIDLEFRLGKAPPPHIVS